MHSHILPGIDDGSPDIETSLNLIRGLHELGYNYLIATPHIMAEVHPNTDETIEASLNKLLVAVKEAKIPVKIRAAAEYNMDDNFARLLRQNKPLRTLDGSRVLVEMNMLYEVDGWEDYLFTLQTLGYKPVLAHPERYLYLKNQPNRINNLIDRGIELQVNVLSLAGYYNEHVKSFAQYLVKKKKVTFLGTDCHNYRHLQVIRNYAKKSELSRISKMAFKNKAFNFNS